MGGVRPNLARLRVRTKALLRRAVGRLRQYLWGAQGDLFGTAPHRQGRWTILYVPGFARSEEIVDLFCRMMWYLNPVAEHLEKIYIPASFSDLPEMDLPSYLDPSLLRFRDRIEPKLELFPDHRSDRWKEVLEETDVIMNWREDLVHPNREIESLMKRMVSRKRTWKVDRFKTRFEGSFYLYATTDMNPTRKADLEACRRQFEDLALEMSGASKGYIFGTGPSLGQAFDFDFSDGFTIACNSMVKNQLLLEHIDPKVIVVADPIFHAGCSSYAGEFRKHLAGVLERFDPYLVVPFRDYNLYKTNLGDRYTRKLIGIPLEPLDHVNVDLLKSFRVKSVGNVLTLLLIPLASTFFKKFAILGCDGRLVDENDYFWRHDPQSQFDSHMEAIKECHPAFFNIDYDDYYSEHLENLEVWLSAAERKGVRIRNLTRSYIPALQRRTALGVEEKRRPWVGGQRGGDGKARRVALVDPDLRRAGHGVGVAAHAARLFSRVFPEVLLFDVAGMIEERFERKQANVEIVQLPESIVRSHRTAKGGEDLATHFHNLWKFVEDHDVDHIFLLYEGSRRGMYRTMPQAPYSIFVHVAWSLRTSLEHPRIGPAVRRSLKEARAIFVPEEYLGESLKGASRKVARLPVCVFDDAEEDRGRPGSESRGSSDGVLRLGTVGVLSENRNVDFLIKALCDYVGPAIRYQLKGEPMGRAGEKIVRLAESVTLPDTVKFETEFRHLLETEYADALRELDFILLAYDRARELQTCAAMYSAARYGTGVIAPEIRPFTEFAGKYPGMYHLYAPRNAQSLLDVVLGLAKRKQAGSDFAEVREDTARFRYDHSIERETRRLDALRGEIFDRS